MILFLIFFSLIVMFISIHKLYDDYLAVGDITRIRSCILIHERNFIIHLINIGTEIYELHLALEKVYTTSPDPILKTIAYELDSKLKTEYVYMISRFIKLYPDNDMCLGKNHRVIIVPITSLGSLQHIKFTNGIIPYIGDGSISNPNILERIIEMDFDRGKLCISCETGRFVIIAELSNRQMGYYKVLEGEFELSSDCVQRSNRFLDRISMIESYIDFCE